MTNEPTISTNNEYSEIEAILNLARWAPSGDNTQPWRFEILDGEHVRVHGYDTSKHCVYDLDGHGSQLALGALLETLSLAATGYERQAIVTRRRDIPATPLVFDVHLKKSPGTIPDPLLPFIPKRIVQRRPLSTRPLTREQKTALEKAVGEFYRVAWFEGLHQRWRIAKLCFDNAKIRLTIPEAYKVHREIIEWGAQYSEDRIPSRAIGVDPLTERIMHWVMGRWSRTQFFNTYLVGHLLPRLQLDLIPGLACAAHFALLANTPLRSIDDYVAAGRAMQRFWLTATRLGLLVQPEMTPVIFARYARRKRPFTSVPSALKRAVQLNLRLQSLVGGQDIERLFFMGRIGQGDTPRSRSIRKPLTDLMIQ